MTQYKFYYFNLTGRGELSRLLFAVSGIEFEDVRINIEDWSALKPGTPLGLLLYLFIFFRKSNFIIRIQLGTLPYLEISNTNRSNDSRSFCNRNRSFQQGQANKPIKLVCSIPCARYIAAEGNLLGSNNIERVTFFK